MSVLKLRKTGEEEFTCVCVCVCTRQAFRAQTSERLIYSEILNYDLLPLDQLFADCKWNPGTSEGIWFTQVYALNLCKNIESDL